MVSSAAITADTTTTSPLVDRARTSLQHKSAYRTASGRSGLVLLAVAILTDASQPHTGTAHTRVHAQRGKRASLPDERNRAGLLSEHVCSLLA